MIWKILEIIFVVIITGIALNYLRLLYKQTKILNINLHSNLDNQMLIIGLLKKILGDMK
jgi:hypothetical protein